MARDCIVGNKNPNYKHGGKGTRIYNIWKDMRRRCNLKHIVKYPTYAGVGTKVCLEWQDFVSFRDWALSNGYTDDLSIDRINTYGHYEPSNCRWATDLQQGRNSKCNTKFKLSGEVLTMSEVSEKYNISQSKLSARVTRLHWPIEQAILNINTKRGVNSHG